MIDPLIVTGLMFLLTAFVAWVAHCVCRAQEERMIILICGFPGQPDWIENTRTFSRVELKQHVAYLVVGMNPERLYDAAREVVRAEMAYEATQP